MIDNVTQATDEEQRRFEKEYGHYNAAPPNWKELTQQEFAVSDFFTYCITRLGFKCFPLKPGGPLEGVRMFFIGNDGHGYGIVNDWRNKTVRYFQFNRCIHEYRAPTADDFANGVPHPRRCFHVSVCSKCGYVQEVDSSD